MPYDQNGNFIPEWVDMGEDQQAPDLGPFAQALKKRFAAKPTQQPMGHASEGNMGGLHESGMGGMKSL